MRRGRAATRRRRRFAPRSTSEISTTPRITTTGHAPSRPFAPACEVAMTVTTISQIPTANCRDGISTPSPIGRIATRNNAQQIASAVVITVPLVVVTSTHPAVRSECALTLLRLREINALSPSRTRHRHGAQLRPELDTPSTTTLCLPRGRPRLSVAFPQTRHGAICASGRTHVDQWAGTSGPQLPPDGTSVSIGCDVSDRRRGA